MMLQGRKEDKMQPSDILLLNFVTSLFGVTINVLCSRLSWYPCFLTVLISQLLNGLILQSGLSLFF